MRVLVPILLLIIFLPIVSCGSSGHHIKIVEGEWAYLDTIDCEHVRKNATIDDDSIPPRPEPDVLLYEEIPELLYDCIPDYPSKAVKHKKTAEVRFSLYIDKTGCVLRIDIDSCTTPGYGFEEAVTECVYSRKYIPVVIDDKPIGLWISEKMTFTLP